MSRRVRDVKHGGSQYRINEIYFSIFVGSGASMSFPDLLISARAGWMTV